MMHLLACFQCELIEAFMKELSSLTSHHLVGKPVTARVIHFDVTFLASLLSSACALRPFKISHMEGRYTGCTVIQRCLVQEQERDPMEFFSGSPILWRNIHFSNLSRRGYLFTILNFKKMPFCSSYKGTLLGSCATVQMNDALLYTRRHLLSYKCII